MDTFLAVALALAAAVAGVVIGFTVRGMRSSQRMQALASVIAAAIG